jgi:CelD/BcsL family acetyltransferase involved in cellulose biosynthesis
MTSPVAARREADLDLEVHRPATLAETVSGDEWRALEQDGGASLFQSWCWLDPWCRIVAPVAREQPVLVLGRSRSGEVRLILPLSLTRRAGESVLGWLGQSHAGYSLPLIESRTRLDFGQGRIEDLVRWAAREAGAGVIHITNQPLMWDGDVNVHAMSPIQSSANDSYVLPFEHAFEAQYARLFSAKTRSKLRRKARRLADIGPLLIRDVKDPVERQRALGAFFRQKAAQLRGQGVPNVFEGLAIQSFYDALAAPRNGEAALQLMTLSVGDRIGAVVLSMRHAGTTYILNTSFAKDTDLADASPGQLLIHAHVRACHAAGMAAYDFGPGEAPYKSEWNAKPLALGASTRTVRVRGLALAAALRGATALKRGIKRSPRLWRAAKSARRIFARCD